MARRLPLDFDEFFLIGVILSFLMINFNLNLSSVYSQMTIWLVLGYLVPIMFNLFPWIPIFASNKSKLYSILTGIGFAIAFIFFYQYLQTGLPIGKVFAAAAFGESQLLTQFVYVLVAAIETIFFFRVIPQWFAWKANISIKSSPFSKNGLLLIVFFAAVFTIFHATAFGVTNNLGLIATFIFGALSMGMVLYFQQVAEALVMHVVVNAQGVGFFDGVVKAFQSGAIFANTTFLVVVAVGIGFYMITTKKLA